MKKKLIILLMMCVLMLSLVGCAGNKSYEESTEKIKEDYGVGYFTVITEWGRSPNYKYRIVYANDTNVKYLIVTGGYQYGITPLYNTDGTLQIYDGD